MYSTDSKFDQVILGCKRIGKPFVDPDFPAEDKSLYVVAGRPNRSWPKVDEWRRVSEICPKPQMFVGGVAPGDVIQGCLGDCWFLGALSVVATREELLLKCIRQKEVNEYGVYEFCFYKNGEPVYVILDDLIPCNRGKPIFSRCVDVNEVWVMLMEKAYAKLHTTYENLDGGNETYAMVDMTGGAPQTIELDSKEGKDMYTNNKLWPKIIKYLKLGYLLGCAVLVPEGQAEANTGKGILQNHAYGILDAKEVKGERIVRVRNPWGQGEWKGRWADGSKEWTPDLQKSLNYKFEDDGTFWMELGDFAKQFNRFYIVRIFHSDWSSSSIRSEWKGQTAGGCPNFPTWKNGPQYGFELNRADDVFISLMQNDIRVTGVRESNINVGFLVLKIEDLSRKITALKGPDMVTQTVFNNSREISKKLKLQAGSYVIVPCTFYPNKCTTFILRLYTKGGDNNALLTTLHEAPNVPTIVNRTLREKPTEPSDANGRTNGQTTNKTNIADAVKPFEGVATRKFPPKRPPNPLYTTAASDYGKRTPNEHERPNVNFGKSHVFSKANHFSKRS